MEVNNRINFKRINTKVVKSGHDNFLTSIPVSRMFCNSRCNHFPTN